MQLLDRYLEAMRFWLPESEQDDIINELSENIRAQVEDREAELGRPLTVEEESAILKKHGHPMLFGVRYGRGLKHLIGPVVYPFYKLVIKISLVIIAIGQVINAVVLAYTKHPLGDVITSLFGFFHAIFPMLGWVTVVFAVLDRVIDRYKLLDKWAAKWDPATLPKAHRAKPKRAHSWFHYTVSIIVQVFFLIWWIYALYNQFWLLGPASNFMALTPIWFRVLPLTIVAALLGIASEAFKLVRGEGELPRWIWLAHKAFHLIIIYLLVRSGNLLMYSDPAGKNAQFAQVLPSIDAAVVFGLTVAFVISLLQFAWDVFKALRRREERAASRA